MVLDGSWGRLRVLLEEHRLEAPRLDANSQLTAAWRWGCGGLGQRIRDFQDTVRSERDREASPPSIIVDPRGHPGCRLPIPPYFAAQAMWRRPSWLDVLLRYFSIFDRWGHALMVGADHAGSPAQQWISTPSTGQTASGAGMGFPARRAGQARPSASPGSRWPALPGRQPGALTPNAERTAVLRLCFKACFLIVRVRELLGKVPDDVLEFTSCSRSVTETQKNGELIVIAPGTFADKLIPRTHDVAATFATILSQARDLRRRGRRSRRHARHGAAAGRMGEAARSRPRLRLAGGRLSSPTAT